MLHNIITVCLVFHYIGAAAGADVITVTEDSDAVLPCSPSSKENLEFQLIDWKKDQEKEEERRVFMYDAGLYSGRDFEDQDKQFKGRVSFFKDELKNANASIKITKTKVSDSGTYTCIFPRLQPSQTFSVQLVVECILKDRREDCPGTCPKPSAKPIKETQDWSLLQCVVEGASPKPVVEWRDSSGNILQADDIKVTESGGRYDIVLNRTVTKSDTYSCVVTQREICNQVHDDFLVVLPGAALRPIVSSRQTEEGLLLQCEVYGASSGVTAEWKDSSGGTVPAEKPQITQTGGSYNIILRATVTKADTYSCEVTSQTNHKYSTEIDGNPKDPAAQSSGSPVGWILAAVLAVVVLVLVLLGVLGYRKLKEQNQSLQCQIQSLQRQNYSVEEPLQH